MKKTNSLIEKLFFSMLPVQILLFSMESINAVVDGVFAGRFIDASAVGVVGLYYPMVNVLSAIGSVLLGGTAVLCGNYMGRGEREKTEGVFSLNLTLTFITGAVLTLIGLIIPGKLAVLLGANDALKDDLMRYILGYAIGILPMLLAQQMAAFLQLERRNARVYAGIAGMILSNVFFDILLVVIMGKGVFGLALATALSNIVYFLILFPYYLSSEAQLHYHPGRILWTVTSKMIQTGMPGALLIFCLACRGAVINRILLSCSGNDGLSAMSAFNMVCGFFIAFCLGTGAVVRILTSVFEGEEDKAAIKQVVHTALTKGLALSCLIAAAVVIASPFLTALFFPDRGSGVYELTRKLFFIYAFCIPLVLICQVFTNYLQAMGHVVFTNIQSVFDGFFSMVIPAMILAPVMGAEGVWLANPIGIVLTILMVPVYCLIYWRRVPGSADEWMFFRPEFGAGPEDCLAVTVHDISEVSCASERIQAFCNDHGMGKKAAFYAALCLEEAAGNVVGHGFSRDRKKHTIDIRTVFTEESVMLRCRDDCIPFNPEEMNRIAAGGDPVENIGIRMIYKLADEVSYQNLLGQNVLTIVIRGLQ